MITACAQEAGMTSQSRHISLAAGVRIHALYPSRGMCGVTQNCLSSALILIGAMLKRDGHRDRKAGGASFDAMPSLARVFANADEIERAMQMVTNVNPG